jgi:hypothetical protein
MTSTLLPMHRPIGLLMWVNTALVFMPRLLPAVT